MIGSMFKVCFRAIFAMSFCVFAACGGNEAAQKSGDTRLCQNRRSLFFITCCKT